VQTRSQPCASVLAIRWITGCTPLERASPCNHSVNGLGSVHQLVTFLTTAQETLLKRVSVCHPAATNGALLRRSSCLSPSTAVLASRRYSGSQYWLTRRTADGIAAQWRDLVVDASGLRDVLDEIRARQLAAGAVAAALEQPVPGRSDKTPDNAPGKGPDNNTSG
jgi:hypothetical protein